MYQDCRKIGKYFVGEKIGQGSFGTVTKCEHEETGDSVAIKSIWNLNSWTGVDTHILREISMLKELDHENIVKLLDVVVDNEQHLHIVLEYLDADLYDYVKSTDDYLDPLLIKNFMRQILRGVDYCHSHKIVHRDLKPANLLVDSSCKIVKLADFGMVKSFVVPCDADSDGVGSPWYKAPEILFHCQNYTAAVDIWSVGCIFAFMVKKQDLCCWLDEEEPRCFEEIDQLNTIFGILGTPTEETWPGVTKLFPELPKMNQWESEDLADVFDSLELDGINLLSRMLCLDPEKRITASEALEHSYFKSLQ